MTQKLRKIFILSHKTCNNPKNCKNIQKSVENEPKNVQEYNNMSQNLLKMTQKVRKIIKNATIPKIAKISKNLLKMTENLQESSKISKIVPKSKK